MDAYKRRATVEKNSRQKFLEAWDSRGVIYREEKMLELLQTIATNSVDKNITFILSVLSICFFLYVFKGD